MTALCGGGSSGLKPGALQQIAYTSGLIAELLQIAESPWLIPVIPLLTLPTIDAVALCATDPPAFPTFTVAEANALVFMNIGTTDWNSGVSKVLDILKRAAWAQFCECSSGATPTVGTAPAPPATAVQPVFSGTPGVQPCNIFFYTTTTSFGSGSFNVGGPILRGLTPSTVTFTVRSQVASPPGPTARIDWVQQTPTNASARTDSVTINAGDVKTITVPAVAGLGSVIMDYNFVSGTGSMFLTNSEVDTYCGDVGLPTATTTCPPDPTILAMLEQIKSLLTIVQRQSVPFAYIPGTVHGPLGLSGEFNLTDVVLGLKVEVSGIDGTVGEQILDPLKLFNVGYVSIGDADGFWCQTPVTNPSMLYFPKFAGSATKVGWTSTSNARLTITELLRER